MPRIHGVLFTLALTIAPCLADTTSLMGNFDSLGLSTQWDPFLAVFATSAASDVTIRSFGYGGGVNAHAVVIPAGGFAPILSLFAGTGPTAVFLDLNDGATCTGCSDPILELTGLAAGVYTLAVTPYANYPWAYWDPSSSSTLADGFIGLGFLGAEETADFAVDISSDALAAVPEPAGLLSLATILVILTLGKWRRPHPGRSR